MKSGAPREDTATLGYTESHRLYYRLRRQRYIEAGAQGGAEVAGERVLANRLAERDEKIAKLEADTANLRDLALRARAELDNARKRFQREKVDTVKYANERLMRELIGTIDNLERAVQSAESDSDSDALRQGVQMVLDQFLAICKQNGLEPIVSDGQQFDPHFHEAVSAEERSDVEDNQILDTLQKGYILNGRVIRPAMVRVAKYVEQPAAEEEPVAEEGPEAPEDKAVVMDADSVETVADLDDTQPIRPATQRQEASPDAETPPSDKETETPEERQQAGDETKEESKEPPPDQRAS